MIDILLQVLNNIYISSDFSCFFLHQRDVNATVIGVESGIRGPSKNYRLVCCDHFHTNTLAKGLLWRKG